MLLAMCMREGTHWGGKEGDTLGREEGDTLRRTHWGGGDAREGGKEVINAIPESQNQIKIPSRPALACELPPPKQSTLVSG